MSRGTFVNPDKEFFDVREFLEEKNLQDTIDNLKFENRHEETLLKMLVISNPLTFSEDCRKFSARHKKNGFGKDYSIDEYISMRIDTIWYNLESNTELLVGYEYIQNEFFDENSDNYEIYQKYLKNEDVDDDFSKIFEPDSKFQKPYIALSDTICHSEYELEEEIEETESSLNCAFDQLKMWAMSDKPSLANAGMEAKDKTKYCDDKFDYTDVVSQIDCEIRKTIDWIEMDLRKLAKLKILKDYYSTQEIYG